MQLAELSVLLSSIQQWGKEHCSAVGRASVLLSSIQQWGKEHCSAVGRASVLLSSIQQWGKEHCSAVGRASVLLSSIKQCCRRLPVGRVTSLAAMWVTYSQTLPDDSVNAGSVCVHLHFNHTGDEDPDVGVLDKGMAATGTHPTCNIPRTKCTFHYGSWTVTWWLQISRWRTDQAERQLSHQIVIES